MFDIHWRYARRLAPRITCRLHRIDLDQVHGFDPATPIEKTLGALDPLVRHGHDEARQNRACVWPTIVA